MVVHFSGKPFIFDFHCSPMRPNVAKGLSLCHIYKQGRADGAPIHQIQFSPPDPKGRVVRAGKAPGAAGRLLKMSSARKGGASGASVVSQDCPK